MVLYNKVMKRHLFKKKITTPLMLLMQYANKVKMCYLFKVLIKKKKIHCSC